MKNRVELTCYKHLEVSGEVYHSDQVNVKGGHLTKTLAKRMEPFIFQQEITRDPNCKHGTSEIMAP
jgi:hypothetical protein